ncbi:type 1 glutamine amidotransferase domain-containing protein [Halioxenophilus aromaticivorans]|uniref:Type 1 glutamine amidotransferase domain-containing protein n=1 Tax=Halioxenophilus aromaticivorans TaxID=1306992 RepID=A0AAV3U8Q3_9ALTE
MNDLMGRKIAVLATDGFEQCELEEPIQAFQTHGAETVIISLKDDDIQGFNHQSPADMFHVDETVATARADEYDALLLPGGVHNPDSLRANPEAVKFVQSFFSQQKPVAAICHGPWMLVEADVVKGRTLTSFNSVKTDIINAGGNWVDEPVVVDGGLITSRTPDDLDAFCRAIIDEILSAKQLRYTA